jgi:vacuolar protein sorting-associated protein 13A/C
MLPYSCSSSKSVVVVIDAGHLTIESSLIDKDTKKDIESKQGSELTDRDVAKLESLLYDRFTCTLTSVQVCKYRIL